MLRFKIGGPERDKEVQQQISKSHRIVSIIIMRFFESIIILVTIISFFSSIDALFGFGNKKKEVDKVTCYYMRLRLSHFMFRTVENKK